MGYEALSPCNYQEQLEFLRKVAERNREYAPLKDYEEPTIFCPEMVFGGVPVHRPTYTETDCKRRILHNAPKCRSCTATAHLREELGIIPPPPKPPKPKKPVKLSKPEEWDKTPCECGEKVIPWKAAQRRTPVTKKPMCECCYAIWRVSALGNAKTTGDRQSLSRSVRALLVFNALGNKKAAEWCKKNADFCQRHG